MLAEQRGVGAEHLASANLKTSILESLENLAGAASCNAIGLEKNERRIHETPDFTGGGLLEKQIFSPIDQAFKFPYSNSVTESRRAVPM